MRPKALIHQVEAHERRGRRLVAFVLLWWVALGIAGWVGLSGFLITNAAMGTFEDLQAEWIPDTSKMTLSLPDPSQVSYIYAADGTLLSELHDGRNSKPVRYEDIPEHVIWAVISAEDRNFFEHDGFDYPSLISAALDTLRGNMRGGSTITQQIAKNVFVGSDVTVRRKINEALVATELEKRFTKERLLEYYLNSVYFGAGAYGVSAAAEEYFGKTLDELTVAEAAALMVPIRNPSFYNPRRNPEGVIRGRNRIIDIMAEDGHITEEEAEAAKKEHLDVIEPRRFRGPADHVVAEVTRQLLHDKRFDMLGGTIQERKQAIFGCPADDIECEGGGGLHIWTVTDLALQEQANRILEDWFPLPDPEENWEACKRLFPNDDPDYLRAYAKEHTCAPTGALTMVDNQTGAVLVMASGLDFEFSQFNLAIQARRNPGSAFKPFALVAALENGITLGHTFPAHSPMEIDCGEHACSEEGNIWTVHNAGGTAKEATLDQATSSSINTVYAQLAVELGPQKIVEAAQRMGIRSPLRPYPSLVLGTSETTTLEMASAYSNFATNGRWAEPYLIEKITDSDGNIIYQHQVEPKQVINPLVAAAARRPLMRVPTEEGTAPRANIGVPQGGKTGTHQSYYDAWYVGFTPRFTTAVWVGYEAKQQPLVDVTIRGERYSRVYGGTVPAPIWAEYMRAVHDKIPAGEFDEPDVDYSFLLEPAITTMPIVVSLDVEDATRILEEAGFVVEVEEADSVEPEGRVIAQHPQPGEETQVGTAARIVVSNGEAPRATLPDVAGMSEKDAVARLRSIEKEAGVQLDIRIRYRRTDQIDAWGKVIGASPAAGTEVAYGQTVTLEIGERPPETTTTTTTSTTTTTTTTTTTVPPTTTTTRPDMPPDR